MLNLDMFGLNDPCFWKPPHDPGPRVQVVFTDAFSQDWIDVKILWPVTLMFKPLGLKRH